MVMVCEKCGRFENPPIEYLHYHHIIPKCIKGTDMDGRVIVCKKCHNIIHNMLPMFMWDYVQDKDACKENIKIMTRKLMKYKPIK